MEEILVCNNGVMRPANEAELEQMRIDAEQAQSRLPNEVRQKRNKLLKDSDWTQVSDAPVDKQAWATYRQALRDVTTQAGFPTDVAWPTAPRV